MNEAIYNLLILGGYVAFGHLTYYGMDWLWWRYVDWYLARGNRHAKHERTIANRRKPSVDKTCRLDPSDEPSMDLDSASTVEFGEDFHFVTGENDVF